jgi:hypothetical protein
MTDPDAADESLLEDSQAAIDEAREAAKKVAAAEDIEVGDLPAFADSTAEADSANAFSEDQDDEADADVSDAEESDAEESDADAEPEK